MAIKKKCSHINCRELIPRSQQPPYCDTHNTMKQRNYNRSRDVKTDRFYKSRQWQRFRKTVLAEHHYLCSKCNDIGNIVHHIIEVKDDWSKRLKRSNVTVLCSSCHNKVHDRFS